MKLWPTALCHSVKENGKVILDPYPESDQHRSLITSRSSPLARAYQGWLTSIKTSVNHLGQTHRDTHRWSQYLLGLYADDTGKKVTEYGTEQMNDEKQHTTHHANVGHPVSRSTPLGERSKCRSLRSYRLDTRSSQTDFWWNSDSAVNQFLQAAIEHNQPLLTPWTAPSGCAYRCIKSASTEEIFAGCLSCHH